MFDKLVNSENLRFLLICIVCLLPLKHNIHSLISIIKEFNSIQEEPFISSSVVNLEKETSTPAGLFGDDNTVYHSSRG